MWQTHSLHNQFCGKCVYIFHYKSFLQCNKLCLAHVKRSDDLYENNNLLKWRDELQFHTFYIKLEYLMTLEYSNLMHDNI